MFYYGFYRDDRMKTRKGIEAALSDFETGAIERGMSFIAFSQIDFPHLMGWRYFVCGAEVETLICECNRYWLQISGGYRGSWEMFRLDRKDFIIKDTSGKKKDLIGSQLTFS